MDTTLDQLMSTDAQSGLIVTRGIPLSSFISENVVNTSIEEFILDLSQRPITAMSSEIIYKNSSIHYIDNWSNDTKCNYTDSIDDDLNRISIINSDNKLNIEQSLTDQLKHHSLQEDSLSDSSNKNQSKLDLYSSKKKKNPPSSRIIIHELESCLSSTRLCSSNFLWSKYLSQISERSVSDGFFDHYLASIESGFEINMKLEYCYDIQRDLYWLTQIQLISHSLILLHYVGLPDDDTSNDFWAYIYGQRCHPIGWCKENSKLMLPPPIVTKRAIQQATLNNNTTSNGNEKQSNTMKGDPKTISQTPSAYLFDQDIGLTRSEQLKKGMLLEMQDINRPWTLWFVRIINNRGGRLHLRYVTNINVTEEEAAASEDNSNLFSLDTHIFYLDRRIHFIGWTSLNSSIYFYDIPTCFTLSIDKQSIINMCIMEAEKQFLPPNLFKGQEEIVKHRFTEGMKLEVFESKTQNVHIGRIGHIHNEYYFDVIIDNEDGNELSFIAHSTHPYLLPAHWAGEHKLALMNDKGVRQTDDYWNLYTEKNGINNLASEKYFNLITLNPTGNNRVEPGMKMEMICTLDNKDIVFSVTLVHVSDHLMWLRVDDTSLFNDENLIYQVVPINSLDVFPVGWAKFNDFQLITPFQYETTIKTYEQNRYDLFSSVTHYPKIPRAYLNEVYLLTIYVNIQCFYGPHFCSSRLARIPARFGPGPYRDVLIDMFHHLLAVVSTNAHRTLRRLDYQANNKTTSNMRTEYIKVAKRSSKLIRPISIPNEPRLVHHYLRHICTQLEACPNLISMKHVGNHCSDKCHILRNTFAFSSHSKPKRPQLRAAQSRYRKQKSLLCHLKNTLEASNVSSPVVEELPSIELQTTATNTSDISPSVPVSLPGCDRQTRGFRVHIERKTHTVTRTNRKQKLVNNEEISSINVKQEPIEINNMTSEASSSSLSSTTTNHSIQETKRTCISKKKRSISPSIVNRSKSPVTLNILSTNSNSSLPLNKKNKKLCLAPTPQSQNDINICSNIVKPNIESQNSPTFIRPIQQYSIPPPIDPRNPVTWNVNDVCWYLNKSGCSFALKTIKEQEIDGAALLLLDDLNTIQDLLEFKLGPAVKFCHVVEQLRTQVIDTFHSSPSLKTRSHLSTK
ncbi:unnamed protein product [Rotaria magnacalcarata]